MNTKGTLLLLVIALAVLGAIYYQNQKEEQTFASAAIPVHTIAAVTSNTVERIVVDAPDQEAVTLTKSGDQWFTNVERKYAADAGAVMAVINALENPITASVVSSNPDSFSEYQVTDTSSTKVRVFEKGGAEPSIDLLVGKNGPSAFTTYVRMAGAEDVLNAKANLGMTFNPTEGWRDRQIFDFSGANATRIEEAGTSATFAVAKSSDDKWIFEGPITGEADSARITSMANMLASLRAEKFLDMEKVQNLANFGLEPPRQTISLTYEDKITSPSKLTSVTLLIGNEAAGAPAEANAGGAATGGGWYAKRADKAEVFTIGTQAAGALTPDPKTMKVAPPPEPEQETTESTATQSMAADVATTETTTSDSAQTTEASSTVDTARTIEAAPVTTATL